MWSIWLFSMIVVFILSVFWWISKPGLWNFLMGGTACGEIWVLLQWSKERYTHLNAEFQRIARRDEKAFLSDQNREIEEDNRMGTTRDLFKKNRDTKGTFHAKMGSIKDRNCMELRVRHDWVTSLSLFIFMHWRRKWQPIPVFLTGESQGWGSLVVCCLWGCTESDMTEAT